MLFFKYQADIIPIFIFIGLFLIDLYMYILGISGILLWLYAIFSIITKAFICAWNHHHQHLETFSSPILNRFLELIYGFQTGVVGYVWVLHHNLGHHVHYQDQSKDESAWKSPKGSIYNSLTYTWIVSITAYYRAWKVGKKYPKIQRYFLIMCLVQLILCIILVMIQPLQGLVIFVLPMITGIVITVYTTYHHHSGLESNDPYRSSYNIVTPWYNLLTGNLGYHTAHHLRGSLHWSKLPAFHKTIEDKIEDRFYKNGDYCDIVRESNKITQISKIEEFVG